MKTILLCLVVVAAIATRAQQPLNDKDSLGSVEKIRNRNVISLSGGVALEAFNLRYTRSLFHRENRFVDIEVGAGRGLALVTQSASGGVSFNIGKDKHYFCAGVHYTYARIDFFGKDDYYWPSLSAGYHFRDDRTLDVKLRLHAYCYDDLGYPVPGGQISIGKSF